jgi:hypothetical protein
LNIIMRGNKDMKAKTLLMRSLMLIAILAVPLFAQDPIPTSEWTSFIGLNCTINGNPLPVGSVVTAFDPQGVLCGKCITTTAGQYGSLDVYGDDAYSPLVDEGCLMNDAVVFKINGVVATKLGPDNDLWRSKGPYKTMNLSLTDYTFAVAATAPGGTMDTAGSVVNYEVKVKNNGTGVDLIALSVSDQLGWSPAGGIPAGLYYLPGEEKTLIVSVTIPLGTPDNTKDTLAVVATSLFDPTATVTKKIVTVSNTVTGVDDDHFNIPGKFRLNQNFPNPFNPETVISFSLEKSGEVTLSVFDILGRTVKTLQSGYLAAGQHEFRWNGADDNGQTVSSGVYFYRLSSDQVSLTRKMVLMK